ncbi:SRSO17 transposase [Labrenzia sp. EL_208]|nr:SRSO17 transposase [Labrenzia sp. EL_132]MBG6229938.1 SRSO17 transposase [Labrenzia sp. EL_208]
MDWCWQGDLERWLAPFLAALRHKTRARMCPAYIEGLIVPGDRKSIQPTAERSGAASYDQLHHFIASSPWDPAPVEAALLAKLTGRLAGMSPG